MTRIENLRVFGEWLIAFIKQPLNSYFRYKYYKQRKYDEAVTKGRTLAALAANQNKREERCNHRKGGAGIQSVIEGTGTDNQYAVIKHTFANGDTRVGCLRCGKKWWPGDEGYAEALAFPTINVSSGSIQFRFPDHGAKHRELTKNS